MSQIHSLLSERVVLNTLMSINPAKWSDVRTKLNTDLFLDQRNKDVFNAVAELYDAGIDPQMSAVHSKLMGLAKTEATEKYLLSFGTEIVSFSTLSYHVEQLIDSALRRQLEEICTDGLVAARDTKSGVLGIDALQNVAQRITSANAGDSEVTHNTVADAGQKFFQLLEDRQKKKSHTQGIRSGLRDLDRAAMFGDGALIIIGARPSMGKTTLMQGMAINTLLADGKPVLIMSAEMAAEDIYERMTNAIGRVDAAATRRGKLDDEQWQGVTRASAILSGKPLHINDKNAPSVNDIRHAALKLKNEYGSVGAIFIDYLQLMTHLGRPSDNESQLISNTSRQLKGLAKEFKCPVVCLSQLNRELEKRPNKHPIIADLRSSGAIEQDADVIMFLYRDEVYNKKSEHVGVAEIIIGKQRNGPTPTVRVASAFEYCQFANLDNYSQEDDQ